MKNRSVLLIAFLVSHFAWGQLTISVDMGYGSNRMNEMKSLQTSLRAKFPADAQVTSSFPSNWYYGGSAKWSISDKVQLGGAFALGSTSGRVYYSDNSGSMGSDQLLSYKSYQLLIGMQKSFLGGKLKVDGDLRPGITVNDLKINSYKTVGGVSHDSLSVFSSANLTLQPTITFGTRFGHLGIHGFVGYNISVIRGIFTTKDGTILDDSGGDVHADWSGIRAGAGISMYFNKSTPKPESERKSINSSMGLGLGLDYGGVGINVAIFPGKHVGIFGGGGWALAGLGYNVGLKLRFNPIGSPKASPFVMGMYGYNAAIFVRNAQDYNKLFYGSTVGFGVDFASRHEGRGHWVMALLVPIRDSDVYQYIDKLKANGVKFDNSLLPVTISIGYRLSNMENK